MQTITLDRLGEPATHAQFRPGRELGDYLADSAQRWNVSIGEAAKHLCVMGATGFAPIRRSRRK